jgi:hypothetical protein
MFDLLLSAVDIPRGLFVVLLCPTPNPPNVAAADVDVRGYYISRQLLDSRMSLASRLEMRTDPETLLAVPKVGALARASFMSPDMIFDLLFQSRLPLRAR